MMIKRQILVTSALPYANGSIHLGHMVEHIQTDIWVRFQKMRRHECYYICADDAHGTPVMLAAQKQNKSPDELIAAVRTEHLADFTGFLIEYDNYYTTHSPENQQFAVDIYQALKQNGKITSRNIEQLFDAETKMFLPDRFVKGECPKCGAKDQYGDNCEVCGTTYNPTELKNPYSVLSGSTPVLKESEHFFFKLGECTEFLQEWTEGKTILKDGRAQAHLQPEALNKMHEWLESGLQDWDISRDAPYFGFEIPDAPGKYFYVWLDAPIGYMASFKNFCDREQINFDDFFSPDSQSELYHFIGKDILYFHALFWPATLKYANLRTPTAIFAHGFLTVNGHKMSKSRGTFITAKSYLACGLNPQWMRYYIAAKLSSRIEDIDLNLDDFIARVNSDLIGKFINIAARAAGFIGKRFEGYLSGVVDQDLITQLQNASEAIAYDYETREYAKALRHIMLLADEVNAYVDIHKPWELAKQENSATQLQVVCTTLINAFRILTIYLAPVLPKFAQDVTRFLNVDTLLWNESANLLLNHKINIYQHLMQRVDPLLVEKLIKENQQSMEQINDQASSEFAPIQAAIKIDDFAKIDLRVAKVLDCKEVEGSDKLLQFTVDLGFEQRNIFSGIKAQYSEPAKLIGRYVIVVANLTPRKMRFGVSEGMIVCAAGLEDTDGLFLLDVDEGAKPGMRLS